MWSDDSALEVLLGQLFESSAQFLLGDRAIPGAIYDRSFVDRGGRDGKVRFARSINYASCAASILNLLPYNHFRYDYLEMLCEIENQHEES